jgi:hypothetical protein
MAKQTFTTGQVLTAAQMTSLQQTAMLGGAASAKTASYTLVAADAGTAISMSNASATTITVNTALFAAGDTVQITNLGAGVCTITAGTATVNSSASLALAQYESGTLDFTSTSAAIFIKGAGAAPAGGGMTLLSTTTLSGTTTTISSINQTYKSLVAYIYGVNLDTSGTFGIKPNNTSNVNAITNYAEGSSAYAIATNGGNISTPGTMVANNVLNAFTLQIDNYANSTNYKPFEYYGEYKWSSWTTAMIQGGAYLSNTAISSLVFTNSGGGFTTGTVLLYGVN